MRKVKEGGTKVDGSIKKLTHPISRIAPSEMTKYLPKTTDIIALETLISKIVECGKLDEDELKSFRGFTKEEFARKDIWEAVVEAKNIDIKVLHLGLGSTHAIIRGSCARRIKGIIESENTNYRNQDNETELIDDLLKIACCDPEEYVRTYAKHAIFESIKKNPWTVRERALLFNKNIGTENLENIEIAIGQCGEILRETKSAIKSDPRIFHC